MKSPLVIVVLSMLPAALLVPPEALGQFVQEGNGVIKNSGKIVVRSKVFRSISTTATIENEGRIVLNVNAEIGQDTIGGTVEFARDNRDIIQAVPSISYKNLVLTGTSRKVVNHADHNRSLVTDSLYSADSVEIAIDATRPVVTKRNVEHEGKVNVGRRDGRVILQGQENQDIAGRGRYKELELDNSAGATVTKGGGFTVEQKLLLTRGTLVNSTTNNFTLADSALIVRTTEGALAERPQFGTDNAVEYTGTGAVVSGGELPLPGTPLRSLAVGNSGGVYLASSVDISDSLTLASDLVTDETEDRQHTVRLLSARDPIFAVENAEIVGSIERAVVPLNGSTYLLNNRYTSVTLASTSSAISSFRSRVLRGVPSRFDSQSEYVARGFEFYASGADSAAAAAASYDLQMAYKTELPDESNGIADEDMALQWWDGNGWMEEGTAGAFERRGSWVVGTVTNVSRSGHFALGIGAERQLFVDIKAFLQGPWRGGAMSADLRELNMIPTTPPNIYPYSLDPLRAFISVDSVPSNAIDWVVVEFRTLQTGGKQVFKTGFLMSDGSLVQHIDTSMPMRVDTGTYYIVVHHRNHLAVMTRDAIALYPGVATTVDFTRGSNLFGGDGAAKVVDVTFSGLPIYALYAGDTNGDGKIDENDVDRSPASSWQARNRELYPNDGNANGGNADTDMSGITTTKDVNVNWNNRGKATVVPR